MSAPESPPPDPPPPPPPANGPDAAPRGPAPDAAAPVPPSTPATANPITRVLGRLIARAPRVAQPYFCLDPRSLGIARIYLGFLLLTDLLRRAPDLSIWFSNQGLLPNHTLLWRPGAEFQFSFFFLASHTHEAAVLFALCALCYVALMIGWRTRIFHVLSFLCMVSVHDRVIVLENGGDVVLGLLTLWTMFLPMGARFSVDAMLARLRGHRETTPEALGERAPHAPEFRPVVSLAVLAILLQVSVIYFFNAAHKQGPTWREGSVVHYVLHQDRIVTWLGWQLRQHMTLGLSQAMTWAALAMEWSLPVLILNPFGWRATRRAAVIVGINLHLGFAALLNLGGFSFNMMGYFFLLLTGRDWTLMGRWLGPAAHRARTVYFDAGCGICFETVRVLARLDGSGRLRFVSNQDPALAPRDLDPAVIERTIVVEDPATGRRWTRAAAFAQILRALPAGWLPALVIGAPPVSWIANWVYDAVADNRTRISTALGLAACGVPATPGRPARSVAPEATPAAAWLRVQTTRLREAVVALFLVSLASQVLMENWGVPKALKLGQPRWMHALIEYPRLFQGWSMFAPDSPTGDLIVHVDAVTVDGRHVDPLNLVASRIAPAPLDAIPEWLDHDEYWCDYIARIEGHGAYHGPLREWVFRHHERTGRPEDRIVSFDFYVIEDKSPPPGRTQATEPRKRLVFHAEPGSN